MSPRLDRPLVLEAQSRLPDGAGGMSVTWEVLGTLWAEVRHGAGRETGSDLVPLAVQIVSVTVRAAPESSLARPRPGQRFVDGARRYRVLGVAEALTAGSLYLTCQCSEEVAP